MNKPVTPLEQKIIETILKNGPVTFERFMDMALYEPGLGYYATGKSRIGRSGDYYTSSHLHPAFGMMIARQIEEMWEKTACAEDFRIVEIGAGAGYLCLDILNSIRDRKFFAPVTYVILERSPALMEMQKESLKSFGDKVRWVSSLSELTNIRGCILSNELLDAFPVHVVRREDELKEIYVTFDGSELKQETGRISRPELSSYFDGITVSLEKGYQTEVNLRMKDWLSDVAASLKEGFVLTIDYGYSDRDYYSEDRNRGTLICYRGHELNEDPLLFIGEQDITAHVNFSALKKWGEECGLKPLGFCGQGQFLLSLGIDDEIKRLYSESGDYLSELGRIKNLIMPQGMGESHMVMVQYKGEAAPELRGFGMRNLLGRL